MLKAKPGRPEPRPFEADSPLFLVGRFRSATTALWSALRGPPHRAYYEPDHDGLAAHIEATAASASHRGVSDYWAEYAPLAALIARCHQPDFGATRLRLEADAAWPALELWLQALIEAGPGRAVLKLNRADFRLPWLRARFPQARLIYQWRDPRQSWWSSRRHLPEPQIDDPYACDAFDLLQWTAALAIDLPSLTAFLTRPSYALHYALARLSRLAGERQADLVLCYDRDYQAPEPAVLAKLAAVGLAIEPNALAGATSVELPRSERWFAGQEQDVDLWLSELGLEADFGLRPLAEIRQRHARAWRRAPQAVGPALDGLLRAHAIARGEQTRLLGLVRRLEGRDG